MLTFGMDGGQVGILEERHEVSFGGLLQCHYSRRLEAEIGLKQISNELRSGKRSLKFTLKS